MVARSNPLSLKGLTSWHTCESEHLLVQGWCYFVSGPRGRHQPVNFGDSPQIMLATTLNDAFGS